MRKATLLLLLFLGYLSGSESVGQPIKDILYINSYHAGYGSSDSVMAGLRAGLAPVPGLRLHTVFMDAKRQPGLLPQKADSIHTLLRTFWPAAVVVSDDDAVREVVVPYLKGTSTPVVFCGVNWSAEAYGLPVPNVSGMLEVVPIRETLLTMLTYYPRARRLAVLSEDSPAEEKNRQLLDTLYRGLGLEPTYYLVSDFSTWKEKFKEANATADLLYLPTNGSILGWQAEEAANFVNDNIKVPILTCDDFMMPYAVYGQTKVAREQGEWAAATLLSILGGTPPAAIPVIHNTQSTRWFNKKLASRIHFSPDLLFIKTCQLLP